MKDNENMAVRCFLALYGGNCGITIEKMKNHMVSSGYRLWPDWVDTLKGCEIVGDYEGLRKGINWFIENNAEAYMVLLD